ncbi:MAG TPA: response regulator, partial [Epsilonproteobacteria bacterium]|nr:response regulator [Campylobacterota bacterium]
MFCFTALLSEQFQSDSADIVMNLSIFILILAIFFASYHTFLFYKRNKLEKKAWQLQKETNSKNILDDPKYLLTESKAFIDILKKDAQLDTPSIETYRVQNLLNEVYGLIEPIIEENHIEFIYDIDSSIPIELVGDSLLLEQTLYTLLSQILPSSYHSVVTISFIKETKSDSLTIFIDVLPHVSLDNTQLFEAMSHHLTRLNSTLSYSDNKYILTLPFLTSPLYQENYYTLPSSLKNKKVLLISEHYSTLSTIKKYFEHFELSVEIQQPDFLATLNNLETYDIFMVDIHLLNASILYDVEEIKHKQNFHLISLEQHFGQRDRRFQPHKLVSKYLYTPISMGMIFGLLYELYVMEKTIHTNNKENKIKNESDVRFIEEIENITQESFQDFNTIHILVVEDNKINQKIIQSVLQKSTIDITIANNGQEALRALKENHDIDIVLMDINMPIMDGYQATKRIRQDNQFRNLPIVIVSGLGFRNEIEQMYLAGANAHLTKPFKIGQLYAVFHTFLHQDKTVQAKTKGSTLYAENNNLLNIQKGFNHTQNILTYRDTLRETLVFHQNSSNQIKEYIIKKDFASLDIYCKQTLEHSISIGTDYLSQTLKEILILINNNEEFLLP